MCCTGYCISKWHTQHCEFWLKNYIINHLLLPCFVYIYTMEVVSIQFGGKYHHGLSWGYQYKRSVGFTFATTQVPGCPIGLFSQSKYRAIWICSNNWWWRHDGKIIFRTVFACGITRSHSFRVQLVSYLYRKKLIIECIYFL